LVDALESYPADALLLRQSLHQAQRSGRGDLRPSRHDDEGPDDMPAHIRTALSCSTHALPFQDSLLLLGW
jgi:thiamine phosphate synthase YjbQ (UPF0047 family)